MGIPKGYREVEHTIYPKIMYLPLGILIAGIGVYPLGVLVNPSQHDSPVSALILFGGLSGLVCQLLALGLILTALTGTTEYRLIRRND